mmetsp:Transcript_95507/g.270394  ORF Transcript_95507/g.270394 Transcript_95507/m.270394 type:complete len:251 (+) Transcript_95507:294-1046(+)
MATSAATPVRRPAVRRRRPAATGPRSLGAVCAATRASATRGPWGPCLSPPRAGSRAGRAGGTAAEPRRGRPPCSCPRRRACPPRCPRAPRAWAAASSRSPRVPPSGPAGARGARRSRTPAPRGSSRRPTWTRACARRTRCPRRPRTRGSSRPPLAAAASASGAPRSPRPGRSRGCGDLRRSRRSAGWCRAGPSRRSLSPHAPPCLTPGRRSGSGPARSGFASAPARRSASTPPARPHRRRCSAAGRGCPT